MATNLNATNIDINDPNLQDLFADLQGNILKAHGRDHSLHVFLQFTATAAACRDWTKRFAEQITSARQQYQDARSHEAAGRWHFFRMLLLSAEGYRALGIDDEQMPQDKAFRAGMKDLSIGYDTTPRGDHVPTANPLHDVIEDWEEPFQQRIDALVIIAYGGKDMTLEIADKHLNQQLAALRESLDGIASIQHVQEGFALRNPLGQVIEHFGYNDGVSNPLFFNDEIAEAHRKGGYSQWDPSAPLGLVLAKDPLGAAESYGSFFVYRKLQQNIKGFHTKKSALADALSNANDAPVDPQLAGALVVGRFQDGTPVVDQAVPGTTYLPNNFNFDNDIDGRRCPFASHIRKTNPRGDTVRQFGSPPTIERSRRVVRRGISYGARDLSPEQEWTDAGLLFLCAQNNIEHQFIFMQHTWCNRDVFLMPGVGLDPLVGQPVPGTQTAPQSWPLNWDKRGENLSFCFTDVVRTRGGEYFFAPSLTFLKNL